MAPTALVFPLISLPPDTVVFPSISTRIPISRALAGKIGHGLRKDATVVCVPLQVEGKPANKRGESVSVDTASKADKDNDEDEPVKSRYGTAARVLALDGTVDGAMAMLVEGLDRVRIVRRTSEDGSWKAEVEIIHDGKCNSRYLLFLV